MLTLSVRKLLRGHLLIFLLPSVCVRVHVISNTVYGSEVPL